MADQETPCVRMAVQLAIILVIFHVCSGFNLDPRFSVIKKDSAKDYFGYSVTMHQTVKGDGSVDKNWILAGAPRKQSVVGGQVSGGVIYLCDAASTLEDDCVPLSDLTALFIDRNVNAEDQWLGVVLRSHGKGKKIVTCAHRYIKSNAGLGICYTFTIPLNSYEVQYYIPCKKAPHNNYMEDLGLCQAGISAVIGHDALVMGAPGSVFWRGAMFLMNISDALGVNKNYISTPCFEEGEPQAPPTNLYSYLGYAVDLGTFDGTGNLYFVAGAPRSQEKGEVVIFKNKGIQSDVMPYDPKQILRGTKNFAGFGSSLLAVDLNSDGFDDLIVGAPYYFEKGRGGAIYIYYGSNKMIDNTTEHTLILSRKMSDAECVSLGCEHARFGLSLAKLGDVNIDGFQDFAVGAPYEGNGAVYIYHGSKTGVVDMYAQRITASDVPVAGKLTSFGYSLSGGMDLDANGYPDLLVGSYESGIISLLRSRPIIRLQPEITTNPKKLDLSTTQYCAKDGTKQHCAELELCLTFSAKPEESFNTDLDVEYVLEAEPKLTIARLEMEDSRDAKKKTVRGLIQLSTQGSAGRKCVKHMAYLKEVFTDKLNPMELTVTFSIDEKAYSPGSPGSPLPNINEYPILSTDGVVAGAEPNTVSTYVGFVKKCGANDKCTSNLQFRVALQRRKEGSTYILHEGEYSQAELTFSISNVDESAYLTQVYVQKPPGLTYHSDEGKGQDDRDVRCRPVKDSDTLILCNEIGNPLKQNSTVNFKLTLNNKITASSDILNITTWVNTTSTEKTPENDRVVFPFKVNREADLLLRVNVRPDDQILCSGDPRGASAMRTELDIGPAVNHSFIVSNKGPSNVSSSTLTIEWPMEVGRDGAQGKYLLYLMEEPIVEKGKAECTAEDGLVNPLGIVTVASADTARITVDGIQPLDKAGDRQKREARSEPRVKRAQGGLTVLGCKQKSARCYKVRCKLDNLQGGLGYVVVTMRARLWESTLLQDYRKSGDVQISSYGYVTIDPSLKIIQDTRDDDLEAVTYAVPDFKEVGTETLEWWWILLAVLGGILLLVIIIFCLYKIGFFKRKRPEDMQMYQAEMKQQRMLDDFEEDET
ncbi:integrin alpha-PS1-like [Babylonia areolata]|uniref:integrin alpha-PS1-like n=1 Tax=Babylonia areolata TaxID=304850 RepID=UPI003FD14218